MYLKSMIVCLFFKRPMCLKHSNTVSDWHFPYLSTIWKSMQKNFKKQLKKTYQNPSKIGAGSYQNGVSKTERKNVSTNIEKCRKWTSKWGPILGHILAIWPLFAVPGKPWEPKWLPRPPQESPGPVQASIFTDFRWILVDFVMIFRVMWATFC